MPLRRSPARAFASSVNPKSAIAAEICGASLVPVMVTTVSDPEPAAIAVADVMDDAAVDIEVGVGDGEVQLTEPAATS